ncbi:hypothetical protein ACQKFM_29110 [Paenibacillus xylanexedens]|uniref:hypothetical protein n=1 Tax=Paenibacillus xylanexedens TaxID=528191 RepID=UPI003D01FA30
MMMIHAHKLMQTRVLRRKIRDLCDDGIEALGMELSIKPIRKQIKELRNELEVLERSHNKNAEYEGLIWFVPSGYKVQGEVIGHCKHCEKEVYSGQKFPDPKEEGLFCNYYCRRVYRNNSIK